MDQDINQLKKEIERVKLLLDLSYYCEKNENKKYLLDEFDRLSYKYYKAAVAKMRNIEGNGDGI